jgi:uncharacterized protein YggU (UPF0235/DUF167 family)
VDGWSADADGRPLLKVRVAAAASDGAANAAVIALIARSLGVPRSGVRISSGQTARVKRLEIDGMDARRAAEVFGTG